MNIFSDQFAHACSGINIYIPVTTVLVDLVAKLL